MSYYVSGYDPKSQTIGNPSIYLLLNSENDSSLWTTGNSATWGASGSIAGTFNAKNPTAPLSGSYSYSFVMASGSLNDWAKSGVIAVPLRSRGVTNRTNLVYTYDGSDNDLKWVVYDVTNSIIVSSSTAYVVTSSVGKQVEMIYDLPSNCTQVQFGFQVLVANNTKTLKFDDVQMSDQPFTIANLVIDEAISYTGYTSVDGSSRIKFKTLIQDSGSTLVSDDNSGTFTKFTVLKSFNGTVNASVYFNTGAGNFTARIERYNQANSLIESNCLTAYISSTNPSAPLSLSGNFNVGDYFQVVIPGFTVFDGTVTNFSIIASAISTNILQTWQDGRGSYKSLTYTEVNALSGNQGLGTFTAGSVEYMIGADGLLRYKGKLTVGTVSAGEARIPLPSGYISANTDKIPSLQYTGMLARSANASAQNYTLIEPNVGYFTMSQQGSGSPSLTKANGSTILGNGESISFNFTVPVAGVSSTPTIVALPTATQTEYYIEAAGNAGQAITASVTDIPFIATVQNNLTWDGSGFTAPISGNYSIEGMFSSTTTISTEAKLYISGVYYRTMNIFNQSNIPFSTKVYLTAGQRLSIRSGVGHTANNTINYHYINITRLNGKNDGVFVGTVAKNQVAYLRDAKASGTVGGSSVAGHQVRTLNVVDGDSSIVSLVANQFTLGAGEYIIKARTPAYYAGYIQCYLRKTSDGATTPTILGSSEYPNSIDTTMVDSKLQGRLSLLTATTFELKLWTASVRASNGLGIPAGSGLGEIYSEVEITKMNGQ